jgi:hypothetical protein
MLTPGDREAISGAFGVPVINTFVSTEGLVGHSEPGGMMLTFASDTCIAECVDEAGRPVPDDTASARVLVTNLHNLTQPLIRYELTDRFTPADASAGGFLRASVEGRSEDIFCYGDITRASVHADHGAAARRASARVPGPPDRARRLHHGGRRSRPRRCRAGGGGRAEPAPGRRHAAARHDQPRRGHRP